MQMLKKIFNSDRKYYLELDESSDSNPVQQVIKAKDAVQEKIKESQPVKQVVETVKEVVDEAQEQLEVNTAADQNTAAKSEAEAETESKASAPAKGKSKTKTSAPAKGKSKTKANSKQATPKNSGASSYDPPFWVAAMYNNNGSAAMNSDGTKAEQTFATDNLMPTVTTSRRRPGPSLNKFKAMASKAKTPKG